MVEGHEEKIKPGTDRPVEGSSFVGPCKEGYVSTVFTSPPLVGEESTFTDRPKSQTSLSRTHYRATHYLYVQC